MPTVRFAWSPVLVNLRREVCPTARWQKQGRQWLMSDAEAQAFVNAAHCRLDFQRTHAQILVDGVTWVIGFVRGAPYQLSPTQVIRTSEPSISTAPAQPMGFEQVPLAS